MSYGKNFNLFLMDGEITGRIKCSLMNWTGVSYKIPRAYLDKMKDRQDLKRSGVYFLFGKTDADEDGVYIGQAGIRKCGDGLYLRVTEHLKDNFYFNDAVMITTQNDSFGPTEISYLENKFTNLAREVGRYKVINANDPNPGNVTEEKESELVDFVHYSKMTLGVLGYKVFVPILKEEPEKVESVKDNNLHLYLSRKTSKSGKRIEAECIRTDEGFVVLQGSMIDMVDTDYLPISLKKLREKLVEDKKIVDGKIVENCLCNSPSYAASFLLGTNANGRTEWKTKDGVTLKEYEENEGVI